MTVRCKTCAFCEPTGQGTRDNKPVDTGICRAQPPCVSVANAGVFPPVALDFDWCGCYKKAKGNA